MFGLLIEGFTLSPLRYLTPALLLPLVLLSSPGPCFPPCNYSIATCSPRAVLLRQSSLVEQAATESYALAWPQIVA
jgi:hypothetical protein